jgi:hypothetical protein
MQIEIHKTKCAACQIEWYELDGYELEECPACAADSEQAEHVRTEIAELEIDPITGKLSFAGTLQGGE